MRRASKFSLRQLAVNDSVGLIAFDKEIHTILPLGPVTSANRETANKELDNLRARYTTNLAGALFEGISQQLSAKLAVKPESTIGTDSKAVTPAADLVNSDAGAVLSNSGDNEHTDVPSKPSPICSVFVFTDGKPTAGITESETIVSTVADILAGQTTLVTNETDGDHVMDATEVAPEAAQAQAAPQNPHSIKVHTFGFGSDTDTNLLTAIADKGSGSYYYINSASDIPVAFADALGGLLSVAAQNMVLYITPVNGARICSVRCGFGVRPEGTGYAIRVSDLYAEEVKDIVVAFELPSLHGEDVPEDMDFVAATVRLEYVDTVRAAPTVLAGEMRIKRSAEAGEAQAPTAANTHVRAQMMRLDAMDSMLRAMNLADGGNLGQAQHILHSIEQGLQSLMVSEASDDTTVAHPYGSPATRQPSAAAAAMLGQLRSDVRSVSHGFSSIEQYSQGGGAFANMVTRSHATQRSTLSVPQAPTAPPAAAPGAFTHAASVHPAVPQGLRNHNIGEVPGPAVPQSGLGCMRPLLPPPSPPPPTTGIFSGLAVSPLKPQSMAEQTRSPGGPRGGFLPRQRSATGEPLESPTKRYRPVQSPRADTKFIYGAASVALAEPSGLQSVSTSNPSDLPASAHTSPQAQHPATAQRGGSFAHAQAAAAAIPRPSVHSLAPDSLAARESSPLHSVPTNTVSIYSNKRQIALVNESRTADE
eukprot:jgi/Ulvmu1/12089/UM084_0012.1